MTISLPERLQDGLGVKAGLTQGSQEGGLITMRDNPDGASLQVSLDAGDPVKGMQGAGQGGDAAVAHHLRDVEEVVGLKAVHGPSPWFDLSSGIQKGPGSRLRLSECRNGRGVAGASDQSLDLGKVLGAADRDKLGCRVRLH